MPVVLLRRPAILPAAGPICPPPTADGSRIFARTNCTLIAFDGAVYQFDGNGPTNYPNFSADWEFAANGVPLSSAIALERNTNGLIYYLISAGQAANPFHLWFLWSSSDKPQVITPSSGPVGNLFVNSTTSATYRTAFAMLAAAVANNTLQIPAMPNGIAQWWDCGNVTADGVTIQGANGAIIGGPSFQGRGSIVATANNLTVKNLAVANGNNGNPNGGIRQDTNFHGLTVDGCAISYFDDGILTGASTGGTTTVKNTTIFNCGDLSGSNVHGSTHNAYIGNEDAVDVQNVTSYRTLSGGHCWKTRAKSGTIGTRNGCIFAQLGGDSTCSIDIPCGGTYVVQNSICHRGPNAENNRFTTFGVEITIAANCDMTGAGGVGSRTMSLIFDNTWFVDDGPFNGSATQICQNAFAQTGVNVTLRNGCRIVSNPNTSPVVFGPNVTDDGTTKHYASRAAAIAAGENIPASYSDSLACLPPIPGADQLVSLLNGMTAGTWAAAPNSQMSSVVYNGSLATQIHGSTGPSAMMSVWAGATLDTDNKQLLVWAGGHQAYYGNELYAFNLPKLAWSRLTSPDNVVPPVTSPVLASGNPAVPHSYDMLVYIPGKGMMTLGLAGTNDNGNGGANCFLINPATQNPNNTGTWAAKATVPQTNGNAPQPGSVGIYDSASGHVFSLIPPVGGGGFGLYDYDPVADSWTIHGTGVLGSIQMTAAINPGVEIVVTGRGFTQAISIAGPTIGTVTNLTTTGDKTVENANGPGFVFYPPTGEYVGWNGGTTLYRFNRSTLTWTAHTATGAVPGCNDPTGQCTSTTGVQTNGTYGRFQYMGGSYNCFGVVNSTSDNFDFYKPDF